MDIVGGMVSQDFVDLIFKTPTFHRVRSRNHLKLVDNSLFKCTENVLIEELDLKLPLVGIFGLIKSTW